MPPCHHVLIKLNLFKKKLCIKIHWMGVGDETANELTKIHPLTFVFSPHAVVVPTKVCV